MSDEATEHHHLPQAARRRDATVTALELFFDLVFVVAITQSTAHAAHHPDWRSLAESILALAALWWSWGGYSWLTSVIDPEEGSVRLVMFAAMAAMLVAALALDGAFGADRRVFAAAYAVVRALHLALFTLASRDDPELRSSVRGLAMSTAVSVVLLSTAALVGGPTQYVLWIAALVLDFGGPFFVGAAGWRIDPRHFAERHGLVVLIALGEAIVATGAGADAGLSSEEIAVSVVGVALAAAMWWVYFDVISISASRRLAELPPGRIQNELARDTYSYLHLPMVGGVVGVALGMKLTFADVHAALGRPAATALFGGEALYLWALSLWKWRTLGSPNRQRLLAGAVLVAASLGAPKVSAPISLVAVTAVMWAVIAYEAVRFASVRTRVRQRQ